MKIIIGLGNPGEKYDDTRHNIGFMVVDKLALELGLGKTHGWQQSKTLHAETIKFADVLLVKPQTFVNGSGLAVQKIIAFYKASPEDVWVIHDDLDLPMGKIRIRVGGGTAGHNGVESIITSIKTDAFVRFRLGIGRGTVETEGKTEKKMHQSTVIKFVLSRFGRSEAGDLRHLVKRGMEAVRTGLIDGIDRAMNKFN